MIRKCEYCQVHFDEKDLYHGACRECIVERDHDHKDEKCEVCNFINYEEEVEGEDRDDENIETRKGYNLNE